MSYELIGKLIFKGEAMQKTESFKLREFAVEKSEEANGKTFVSYVKFQCVQEFLKTFFANSKSISLLFNDD
jgi:threonine dehydratase